MWWTGIEGPEVGERKMNLKEVRVMGCRQGGGNPTEGLSLGRGQDRRLQAGDRELFRNQTSEYSLEAQPFSQAKGEF